MTVVPEAAQQALNPVQVQVGDGVTFGVGSDRYAATVVAVSESGKTISFVSDEFKAGEGHDYFGHQVWEYSPVEPVDTVDPMGNTVSNIDRARWDAKRQRYVFYGRVISAGRNAYQDPSF